MHFPLFPELYVADFVGTEVLQTSEAVLYVLYQTFGMLCVELLQSTAYKGVGSMCKADEYAFTASDGGCIHHSLYMVHTAGTKEVLERVPGLCPKERGLASMQENMSWLWEKHLWCDWSADHKVIIEVYVVFAQTWDAPQHGFDTRGAECRQELLITLENDAMIHYLQRNFAFYMRILIICDKEDASYPWHELVH